MTVVWIVICLLLVALELHHLAFFAIFGAAGAAVAAVVAAFSPKALIAQVCVAVVVAAIGVIAVRPKVSRTFAHSGGNNAPVGGVHGGLIGARGLTLDDVRIDATGHVRILGENWLAVTGDGSTIPPSTHVIVTSVAGTTLTVRAAEETREPA
jgi:membrane protein implicated in regulation of membrane protease activity